MVFPPLMFMNSAPNSVSSSDYATHFKIVQRVKIVPLSVMGSPSLGTERRKKCTDARLLALFVYMQDASEWMFNIMYYA